MEFEGLMKIIDSCWFEIEILKNQPKSSSLSVFEANSDHENEEKRSKPEISRIPTPHKRSMSADLSSKTSIDSLSSSPDSVLFTPKLQTILSGKESTEGENHEEEEEGEPKRRHDCQEHVLKKKSAGVGRTRRGKRGGGESKSLSDLEFEELKGFMDLGFVFTDEDNKDSRLVEIVPGLQRLARKSEEKVETDNHVVDDQSAISRPYLSEAWEVLDMKKKGKNPLLMNWKIPALSNEIDMKDNLRWWAHTVASTVR